MEKEVFKAKREVVDNNIYLRSDLKKKPTQRFIQTLNAIKSDFKKKIKFCDVGCSNGGFISFLKKKFPDNEYYEIEKSLILAKRV